MSPGACRSCGGDLSSTPVVGEQVRQVFDLPPIELVVTEHRAQRHACSCGALTIAAFPPEATAPTRYGPGVAALGAYLLGRQHLPVERAAEAMADCFGAPVSTGWLASLLPAAADKLDGFLVATRAQLAATDVAHFDETGGRVAAKLWWIHVARTDSLTMYHLASGRGKDSMDAGGVLPTFTGFAVHDGLTSYRRYDVTHALCVAHHLRELAGIAEATGQGWPTELADLQGELGAEKPDRARTKNQDARTRPRTACSNGSPRVASRLNHCAHQVRDSVGKRVKRRHRDGQFLRERPRPAAANPDLVAVCTEVVASVEAALAVAAAEHGVAGHPSSEPRWVDTVADGAHGATPLVADAQRVAGLQLFESRGSGRNRPTSVPQIPA